VEVRDVGCEGEYVLIVPVRGGRPSAVKRRSRRSPSACSRSLVRSSNQLPLQHGLRASAGLVEG